MSHPDLDLVERALRGESASCRALIDRLTPYIQQRVNAALIRRRRGTREEMRDLVQDVFRALLDNKGKALRDWDPAKGASLTTYVAMVAERRVASILASGRKSGWAEDPQDPADFEAENSTDVSPEDLVMSRDVLGKIVGELRLELSDKGYEMFRLLYLEEREVEWIVRETGTSRDAVYAWRSRIHKIVVRAAKKLMSDPVMSPGRIGGGRE